MPDFTLHPAAREDMPLFIAATRTLSASRTSWPTRLKHGTESKSLVMANVSQPRQGSYYPFVIHSQHI
jgi:hypothetical protein